MTTTTSTPVSEIYKSRNNILSIMKRQGYNISDYMDFSLSEVNIMKQNNQLDMLIETNDNDDVVKSKVYVKYYLTKTIRTVTVQEMIDDLYNIEEILSKNDTLYIVLRDDINDTMTAFLKHIYEVDGIFIIMESIKRLQFCILDHDLVPEHTVLNENQVTLMMDKHNLLKKNQLPEISRFDPVARAIGIRPDMVCRIIRPSKTSVEADYYRVCV